jgi:hypothetical protein
MFSDNTMDFKHYYDDCTSSEYSKGECKKCKAKKMREYLSSEKGRQSREKTAAKQRLIRRTNRIKEVAENIKTDVEILGIDEDCSQELEQICELIQKISNINLRNKNYVPVR